jgi:DNA-directed RNA polymerase alpha subunit
MNPIVSDIIEDDGILKFTLSGVNVSLANAIRRIILSDIQSIVFKTTPYEENKSTFHINTSRLNNEIIKQRLSCIPIHIDDLDFPINDYILEVDVKNDTDSVKIVTTNDFKIKNISSGKYLTNENINKIFPPDKISGDYIDFVRLRPKISDDIAGEHIKLECLFDISTAKDNGMFNVVSACSYGNTPDPIAINKEWAKREKLLKNDKMSDDDIEYNKRDWMALEANRYFKPDSFDFTVETIGVFDNLTIVKKACTIMIEKLNKFVETIQSKPETIVPIDNTIPNCNEVILENEDYTLGKALEYILYQKHYITDKSLNYCGFRKPHPHINLSIIRLGFNTENEEQRIEKQFIINMLLAAAGDGLKVFEKILTLF